MKGQNKMDELSTYLAYEDLELRRLTDSTTKLDTLVGRAIPYEKRSELMYSLMYEILRKGTFTKSLATNPDVRAYVDHDTGKIIGRTKAKTLTLTEDADGVNFRMQVPDTTYGIDLLKAIDRGDITGMSFGFKATKNTWGQHNGKELRDITEANLLEISTVSSPAYLDTNVYQRSMENVYKELKEHKRLLQDAIINQNDILKRRLDLFERG